MKHANSFVSSLWMFLLFCLSTWGRWWMAHSKNTHILNVPLVWPRVRARGAATVFQVELLGITRLNEHSESSGAIVRMHKSNSFYRVEFHGVYLKGCGNYHFNTAPPPPRGAHDRACSSEMLRCRRDWSKFNSIFKIKLLSSLPSIIYNSKFGNLVWVILKALFIIKVSHFYCSKGGRVCKGFSHKFLICSSRLDEDNQCL